MKELDVKTLFDMIHELGAYEIIADENRRRAPLAHEKELMQLSFIQQLLSLDMQLTAEAFLDIMRAWGVQGLSDSEKLDRVRVAVDNLRVLFKRELSNQHLMYLEPTKSPYYVRPSIGWEKIIAALGDTARQDIEEGSKCYAMNRPTACVFHMCRVFEYGFKSFVSKRAVLTNSPINKSSWKSIADDLRKHNVMNRDKEDYALIQKVEAKIKLIADLWRNDCVHISETVYTDEQALSIMHAIRGLMEDLIK